MKYVSKRILSVAVAAALGAPAASWATNGMNLEGYGPIALGMGGASMAYDNGTAAMMNNPATIGLGSSGNRLDVALGVLGPHVSTKNIYGKEDSSATAFYMPALGWTRRSGQLTYGIGMFAQGGMGTEYDAGSAVDQSATISATNGGAFYNPALGFQGDTSGHKQRSELGVGRLLFPLSYKVNNKLDVGGSIDYVWGGLDIMWSMDANNFFGGLDSSYNTGLNAYGANAEGNRANISGSLVDTFFASFAPPTGVSANNQITAFYWGNFEFSDNSDFTQEARGAGFAGKLGFTYKVNNKLRVGGTYHMKTAMSDFEGDVTLKFNVDMYNFGTDGLPGTADDTNTNMTVPVSGKIKVKDFQWPATIGLGVAYEVSDKLMIAADWKQLKWAAVMESFKMEVTTDGSASNGGFANKKLDVEYYQNWDDQNVIELGAAYKATDQLTVRAGYNHASNPIPNDSVNFLFPATIENHFTFGLGYGIDKASSVDFAMSYAPEVKVTESVTEDANIGGPSTTDSSATPPNTITHSQTNWQIMYSYRF
jgi:long-chain fatty acid transport protein